MYELNPYGIGVLYDGSTAFEECADCPANGVRRQMDLVEAMEWWSEVLRELNGARGGFIDMRNCCKPDEEAVEEEVDDGLVELSGGRKMKLAWAKEGE